MVGLLRGTTGTFSDASFADTRVSSLALNYAGRRAYLSWFNRGMRRNLHVFQNAMGEIDKSGHRKMIRCGTGHCNDHGFYGSTNRPTSHTVFAYGTRIRDAAAGNPQLYSAEARDFFDYYSTRLGHETQTCKSCGTVLYIEDVWCKNPACPDSVYKHTADTKASGP
jgi:hypothetical protein